MTTPAMVFGPSSSQLVASQQNPAPVAASMGGQSTHRPLDPPASQVDLSDGGGYGIGELGFYTPMLGGFVPPAPSSPLVGFSRFGFRGFVNPSLATGFPSVGGSGLVGSSLQVGFPSVGVSGLVGSSLQVGVGGDFLHPSTLPALSPSHPHPGGLVVSSQL